MFGNCRNSKKQGDVGLAAAIYHFASQGYTVALPLTDSQDYDLIVDDGDRLWRVQARTSTVTAPSGKAVVELRVLGGNQSFHTIKHFNSGAVDMVFAVLGDGRRYAIPASRISVKTRLTIDGRYEDCRVA